MAKQNKQQDLAAAEEITVVAVITDPDGQIEKAKTALTTTTLGSEERLAQLHTQYMGLTINGITDIATFDQVKGGIAELKKIRTGIEKKRKELTAPVLRFQSVLKEYADGLAEKVAVIEKHLLAQKTTFEDQKAAAEKQLFIDRSKKLAELGYSLNNGFYTCGIYNVHSDELVKMSDENFAKYEKWGQEEADRKAAEEKRRKEQEEAMQREREELARQREELAKMREENERMRKEMEAQKQALEETYETIPPENEEPPANDQATPQHDNFHHVPPAQYQTAPKPAQAAPAPQAPKPAKAITPEFSAGYEACRTAVVKLLTDSEPRKRQEFIDLIKQIPVAYGE